MLLDLNVPVGPEPGWEWDEYLDSDSGSDSDVEDSLHTVADRFAHLL
jgi:hypothetical protein